MAVAAVETAKAAETGPVKAKVIPAVKAMQAVAKAIPVVAREKPPSRNRPKTSIPATNPRKRWARTPDRRSRNGGAAPIDHSPSETQVDHRPSDVDPSENGRALGESPIIRGGNAPLSVDWSSTGWKVHPPI